MWLMHITLHNVLVWRTNFHRFGIKAYDDIWLLHILCALVIEFVWFLQKSHSSSFSLGARLQRCDQTPIEFGAEPNILRCGGSR